MAQRQNRVGWRMITFKKLLAQRDDVQRQLHSLNEDLQKADAVGDGNRVNRINEKIASAMAERKELDRRLQEAQKSA
jgi:hypothetical protein